MGRGTPAEHRIADIWGRRTPFVPPHSGGRAAGRRPTRRVPAAARDRSHRGTRRGVVFVPFHYGARGDDAGRGPDERAANELTIAAWDPVSKQPLLKTAAVRVIRVAASDGVALSGADDDCVRAGARADGVHPVNVDRAVEDVLEAEHDLADELRRVGERHAVDSGVYHVAETRAVRCADNARLLEPHAGRYGVDVRALGDGSGTLERVHRMASEVLGKSDAAGMLLLTDLKALYLEAHRAALAWVVLVQAAKAVRDEELLTAATSGREEAERRGRWVRTRGEEGAPPVLAAGEPARTTL